MYSQGALRWLNRNAKDTKKGKAARHFKSAAAHDIETPALKLPAKNASLVAKGAAYHVLAGRPSKNAVVARLSIAAPRDHKLRAGPSDLMSIP